MPAPDGRGHPRYAIEVALGVVFAGGRAHGRTRNLSRGGVCALMDTALAPGTPVTIEIKLVFGKDAFSESLALPAR
ncbi:MAG TPA: PilZ domain-containing protein, partial [Kofleriaceae bacterium]|nr:PilZ domain-containing protein [Kofleriaceae bacterium]